MRYFTADLHIGDRGIARWRGFGDVGEHDGALLARLVGCLSEQDELWLLGDLCKPNVTSVRRLREAIPCERVYVVIGNHDRRSKFLTCGGFVRVEHYDEVGKVAREGYKFVMSHYPMLDWDRAHQGSYMLHGHIHSLPARGAAGPPARGEGGMGMRGYNEWNRERGIRRYDVGVDANEYRPVSAEEIVAFFALPGDHGRSSDG